jgi:hypothetical protein
MKNLDFLIIGAQKCATTTLFEHLRAHPDINMPLEKEVPFFTAEDRSAAAWDEFAGAHFGREDGRLWGKATPQYMCDSSIAERIRACMPDVKLVAILRDPIERTWSHYQMGRRREMEPRAFDTAIAELLREDALRKSRALPAPAHTAGFEPESEFYVTWSEYGRILSEYARFFSPQRLLVLYTEDLQNDPECTLDRLLEFIDLEPGFRPDTLGKVLHKGGGSNRIPHSVRAWLRQRGFLYRLWQLLPESRQGRLRFLYEQWNVRKQAASPEAIPMLARKALRYHFGLDLKVLNSLSVATPPWADQYLEA